MAALRLSQLRKRKAYYESRLALISCAATFIDKVQCEDRQGFCIKNDSFLLVKMTLHSIYLGFGLISAIYTLLAIVNALDANGERLPLAKHQRLGVGDLQRNPNG